MTMNDEERMIVVSTADAYELLKLKAAREVLDAAREEAKRRFWIAFVLVALVGAIGGWKIIGLAVANQVKHRQIARELADTPTFIKAVRQELVRSGSIASDGTSLGAHDGWTVSHDARDRGSYRVTFNPELRDPVIVAQVLGNQWDNGLALSDVSPTGFTVTIHDLPDGSSDSKNAPDDTPFSFIAISRAGDNG
jgi:hypothetical protein